MTASTANACKGPRRRTGQLASATILAAFLLLAGAAAQENPAPRHEFTAWFSGAFENGHAFGSTMDGRLYELQLRYGSRLFATRWVGVRYVAEVIPIAAVGDPHATGSRHYIYGAGGSPVGMQANLRRFRRVQPFVESNGGFLYFSEKAFSPGATQFNFTAELVGGVEVFSLRKRRALDLGYKYHHISNKDMNLDNPAMDSHVLFIGMSFFR